MIKSFTDQLGREVRLVYPPKRIISIVPSQTELLFYLGLEKEVIGITKFCIHPIEQFKVKTRVGGTKNIKLEKIIELEPDLIIGNKEENDKAQIEELAKKYPVWLSDINNFEDALVMITDIGELCGKPQKADSLVISIREKMDHYTISLQLDGLPKPKKATYFIWRQPYMVAGSNTFIHSMMQLAGFENVFGAKKRYPETSLAQLKSANPEVILLSSEPYPFTEKHIPELQEVCPGAKILIVDGEMFSWYGNRLLQSFEYFQELKAKIW